MITLPDNAVELFERGVRISKESGNHFAWPDDALSSEPWAYDFHIYWVSKWNADGRRWSAEAMARMCLRKLLGEQAKREEDEDEHN